jgi:hypothetical protein
VIDSELDAGQLVVTDRPPEEFTGDRDGFRGRDFHDDLDEDDEEERVRQEEACRR